MLGIGILQGLCETAKNFVGSFYSKDRLVTVQYPEEHLPMMERTRAFPMLIFDGTDPMAGLRCTACQICEKECPPKCIYIVMQRDEKNKPMKHPKVFDLDISVCMSCGICVDVCPFDSIKMNQEYEIAVTNRFEPLLLTKKELARSNEHYHKCHPIEAAEVDARLEAERKKKEANKQPAA